MTDTYRIVVSEHVLDHIRDVFEDGRHLHPECPGCEAFRKALKLVELHPDIPDEEEIVR